MWCLGGIAASREFSVNLMTLLVGVCGWFRFNSVGGFFAVSCCFVLLKLLVFVGFGLSVCIVVGCLFGV